MEISYYMNELASRALWFVFSCFSGMFSSTHFSGVLSRQSSSCVKQERKSLKWERMQWTKEKRSLMIYYNILFSSKVCYLLPVSCLFWDQVSSHMVFQNTPCFCIWSVALRTSVQDFRLVSFFPPELFGHPLLLLLLSAQVIVLLQPFVWLIQSASIFASLFIYPLVSCQFFPGADMSQFMWPNCVDSSIISSLDETLYARNFLKTKGTSKCFKTSKQVIWAVAISRRFQKMSNMHRADLCTG